MGLLDMFVPEIKVAQKAVEDAKKKATTEAQKAAADKVLSGIGSFKADSEERAKKAVKKLGSLVTSLIGGGMIDTGQISTKTVVDNIATPSINNPGIGGGLGINKIAVGGVATKAQDAIFGMLKQAGIDANLLSEDGDGNQEKLSWWERNKSWAQPTAIILGAVASMFTIFFAFFRKR